MSHKILRLTLGAIGLLLTMVVFEGPVATARDDVSTDAGTCAPNAADAACFEEAEAAPEVQMTVTERASSNYTFKPTG